MTHYTECGRPFRFLLAACLLVAGWGCSTTPQASSREFLRSPTGHDHQPLVGPIRTIVIDAGHGGHDAGASHFGLQEKSLNLDIAKRLRAALQAAGLSVIMTRETDSFIALSKRSELANRLPADLFISIHANANLSDRVSGAEVYYPRVSVVAPSAQWPPFVSPGEVGLPTVTVKQVLWDMVLGRTRAHSHRLASSICGALRDDLPAGCKVKPARFVVLREAWMPSVLVEVGYVSNGQEAGRLRIAEYRQAAADSVARGVISYIRELGAQHI